MNHRPNDTSATPHLTPEVEALLVAMTCRATRRSVLHQRMAMFACI